MINEKHRWDQPFVVPKLHSHNSKLEKPLMQIGVWNGGEWVWNGKGNEGDIEGDEEGEGGAWKGNGKAQGREGSGWIN